MKFTKKMIQDEMSAIENKYQENIKKANKLTDDKVIKAIQQAMADLSNERYVLIMRILCSDRE